MERKKYMIPETEVMQTLPSEIIASSSDQINIPFNDTDNEVDAGDALSKGEGNWEFEW